MSDDAEVGDRGRRTARRRFVVAERGEPFPGEESPGR
jgi:hypothetical protein